MAPTDTRRITGPEASRDYRIYVSQEKTKADLHKRPDGRPHDDDHRTIFMKTGVISQAKGSAYLEQGQTKVICGVYGPREIPRRSDFSMKGILFCQLKRAPFAGPSRRAPGMYGTSEAEDKELGQALKEALEATVALHLYPKSQIDIHVIVLEDAGSVLASALTCAGLALADASIHMFDTLIGASLKRVGDRCLTDPVLEEEIFADKSSADVSCLTIGYQPSLEQTVQIFQEGNVSPETVLSDIQHLTKVCTDLSPNVERCLISSIREKMAIKKS